MKNKTDRLHRYKEAKTLLNEGRVEEAVAIYASLYEEEGEARAESAYSLAIIHETGFPKELSESNRQKLAEMYYQAAFELNYEPAMLRLASLYYRQGRFADAYARYAHLARHNPSAAYWAARILDKMPRLVNEKSSQDYYHLAANMGHVYARKHIAIQYLKGSFGFFGVLKGVALYIKLLPVVWSTVSEEDKNKYT